MSESEPTTTNRLTAAARGRAISRLILAYRSDFDQLLAEERERVGLSPHPLRRRGKNSVCDVT